MDIGEYIKKQFKVSGAQQFHIEGDIWLVPCVANYTENHFKPLLKPLSASIPIDQKNKEAWTTVEEEILLKIVQSRGPKAWSAVAKELNTMLHDGNNIRYGRHCRERWYNHVDPALKKGEWTEEEDSFIIQQQSLIGNKWSEISKKMIGRTENSVKNRFKSLLRKNIAVERNDSSSIIDNSCEKMIDLPKLPENIDTLLLQSPQIINYEFGSPIEFSRENYIKPLIFRPISTKLPTDRVIDQTKRRLKHEFEATPSPSTFLNFRN